MKIHLLAIDPQIDFCMPEKNKFGLPKGALYVEGAHDDMTRLSSFLKKAVKRIDDVHVTLDSHLPLHIAHPGMWIGPDGKHPRPFTLMMPENGVINGYWVGGGGYESCGQFKTIRPLIYTDPVTCHRIPWADYYTGQLKVNGRYVLCIWPEHCLIGSIGAAIHPEFFDSLNEWQRTRVGSVHYVTKGSNFRTEHYSAVKADVEDPGDPTTQLNMPFIDLFRDPEIADILITGEALSHCVANTVNDIADSFGEDNVKKFVLLTDTTSNVTGFEKQGAEFVNQMVKRGMRTTTTVDYLK